MAVYTHVEDESLRTFLSAYGLPAPTVIKGIAEGVENSNYLIITGGTRYILTLYEKRVDADDLPYFLSLMDHVVDQGVPAAGPVRDTTGQILHTLCGRPAALINFLEGTSPQVPNAAQARAAGKAMAQLHQATVSFSMERPNSLGPSEWAKIVHRLGPDLNKIAPGLHDELLYGVDALQKNWPTMLPKGTIHADLFPDNVLFLGNNISGLIDFYFSCTDFYAYDLAISMNAWTEEGTTNAQTAAAFQRSYEELRPLTTEEQEALPTLLQGAALRFLLTRANDFLHKVPGSLVRVKDPLPYLQLFRHHRDYPKNSGA